MLRERGLILAALLAAAAARGQTAAREETSGARHVLPSWWKIEGEIRGRWEVYRNGPCPEKADENHYLSRLRLSSTVRARPWLRARAEIQDARVWHYRTVTPPWTMRDPLDLRQLYLDVGAAEGEGGWMARAGRQPLVFGDRRLLSTSNWGNVGPNFDGIRLSHSRTRAHLDWFAMSVVKPFGGFDHPGTQRFLHGFYSTWDLAGRRAQTDAYLLWKEYRGVETTGGKATQRLATVGTRWAGRLARDFDYNTEMAIQRGAAGPDDYRAWAGHWELGRSFRGQEATPVRVAVEYNHASGDSNPRDSRRGTFDSLYPTNIFGTAGDIAWRNSREAVSTVEWTPGRRWRVRVAHHEHWVAEREDAVYTTGGAVFARAVGAMSNRVGNQTDVRVIYQHSRHWQIWLGYGVLLPGPYLRAAGRDEAMHFPYVMWTYSH